MEFDAKNQSYRSSMAEMKDILARQKRLGDQCKTEIESLTKKFEEKTNTEQRAANFIIRSTRRIITSQVSAKFGFFILRNI